MIKPIIVGVDIRELRVAKTGIKTYLEELYREFKNIDDPEVRFVFLDTKLPIYSGESRFAKIFKNIRYQVWKQIQLPLKAWLKNCDIVFCVDNCVPYIHLNYKTIHSIPDAFCYESPEEYGKIWLWLYKNTTTPGARRSPYVITATEYGKKQVAHYLDLQQDKLIVVHQGPKRINYLETEDKDLIISDKIKAIPPNYILHVGSMFKRKNIPFLINAFAEVKKSGYPDLKLVLAGSLATAAFHFDKDVILDLIEKTGLADDVIITGYLNDYELKYVYQHALMYVFPSINEGFGMPVLEAFENNLPVLVADNTCLPEVGGSAVITFNPFDVKGLADKMITVLNDPQLRQDMIAKGQERLKDFSWQATALQTIEVFKKAV